jgi:two-component system nitrate/nitrite response regulator NarL
MGNFGEAAESDQLIALAGELKPDIMLLDVSIARHAGMRLVETLRRMLPLSAIVIMSEQEPFVLQHLAQSLSVEYFVSKSALATDLIPQLETILKRGRTS